MNKHIVAASVLGAFLISSAHADGPVDPPQAVSTAQSSVTTRAAVKADLVQARGTGQSNFSHTEYPQLRGKSFSLSAVTRSDVKTELASARANEDAPHSIRS
jgi:hypothetical protein